MDLDRRIIQRQRREEDDASALQLGPRKKPYVLKSFPIRILSMDIFTLTSWLPSPGVSLILWFITDDISVEQRMHCVASTGCFEMKDFAWSNAERMKIEHLRPCMVPPVN